MIIIEYIVFKNRYEFKKKKRVYVREMELSVKKKIFFF